LPPLVFLQALRLFNAAACCFHHWLEVQTQQVITCSVIVSRYLTDFLSFISLLNLRSIISCWAISILLRLSNPKLEKLDVTYRLNVLNKKAAGDKRVTENGFLKNIYCFHFSKHDKSKFLRRKKLSL